MTRKFLVLLVIAFSSYGFFEDDLNIIPMPIDEQTAYYQQTDYLVVSIIYKQGSEKPWLLSRIISDVTAKLSNYVKFISYECSEDKITCPDDLDPDVLAMNIVIPNKNYTSLKDIVTEKPYTGTINVKEIGETIIKEIPYLGEILDASSVSEFIENPKWNKVVLFTNKEVVPLIYKGISSKFRDRMGIGLVFANSSEVLKTYEVTRFPTLIAFGKEEPETYKGNLEFNELVKFLEGYAEQTPLRTRPNSTFDDPEQYLQIWREEIWDARCKNKGGYCLVMFLPGVIHEVEKIILNGIKSEMVKKEPNFHIMAVDGNCFKEFKEKFEVQEVPGIVLISPASGKFWTFGGSIGEKEVISFAEEALLGEIQGKDAETFEFVRGSCQEDGKKIGKYRLYSPPKQDL